MTIDDVYLTGTVDPAAFTARPPWSTPWFLGDAPAPTLESADETDRATIAAELAQLPLMRTVHHLLAFIGEGSRLTTRGEMFAVDRKQVERLSTGVKADQPWNRYSIGDLVPFAWKLLTDHGWLAREDGWVRPTGKLLTRGWGEPVTEGELDGARCLIAAALGSIGTADRFPTVGRWIDEDVLEALLVASGPGGLTLPAHPGDGVLIHCFEVVDFLVGLVRHPSIHDVPIERRTGHVAGEELKRLARLSDTMEHLLSRGLVLHQHRGDEREYGPVLAYRAPVVMRGAVALVRERRTVDTDVDSARGCVHTFEEW